MKESNSMLKNLVTTLIVLFITTTTYAQIKGNVKEEGSNKPIEFVNIALISQADSSIIAKTYTDSTGHFIINNR